MDKYCGAESVEFIPGGKYYFKELENIIHSAREVLHLQTYILDDDETGLTVIDALKKAAERGVKVFVLADGFGSSSIAKKYIKEMTAIGVSFRFFSPLFTSESIFIGRRLHHKIVVADKQTALVGGINIANKYRGTSTELPWLDYAVLIKGDVCSYLHVLSENFYLKKKFNKIIGYTCPSTTKNIQVRFRRNDWIRKRSEIFLSYKEAMNDARKEIIIISSYFHPDPSLKVKIKQARARGVEVKVLLGGTSDVPLSKYGEQYLYSSLLKQGVELYEWPHSVLHCKAIIRDDEWVSLGSYNLNELSHYLCIELNIDINNKKLNSSLRSHLKPYLLPKFKVNKNKYLQINIWRRARNFVVYWCYYYIMKLFLPRKAAVA